MNKNTNNQIYTTWNIFSQIEKNVHFKVLTVSLIVKKLRTPLGWFISPNINVIPLNNNIQGCVVFVGIVKARKTFIPHNRQLDIIKPKQISLDGRQLLYPVKESFEIYDYNPKCFI